VAGPDVLVVGTEWQPRVLLRAQLLEEGWSVTATDTWTAAEALLLIEGLPRVLVLILDEALASGEALDRVRALVPPACTIVLSRGSLMPRSALDGLGFAAIQERPFSIGDVASQVRQLAGP
jgi:CheY-like chemotaxis protein